MDTIDISYWVEPSFSDGYAVYVTLDDRPMIAAATARLMYERDRGKAPYPRREETPAPRNYLSKEEVATLRDTCELGRVPLVSKNGRLELDGTLHRLCIHSPGYEVLFNWGTGLPPYLKHLQPLLEILERHAQQEGLGQTHTGDGKPATAK